MTWRARFGALPAGLRVAIVATAIVAAGAGIISWSANTWAAGEIGIDWWAQWMYGVVIDGAIAAGVAGIFELQDRWHQVAAWAVLLAALAISVVDNGAHAHGGGWHAVGATVPALLLAGCLFLVELLARSRPGDDARGLESPSQDRASRAQRKAPTYPPPTPDVPAAPARERVAAAVQAAAGRRPTGRELAAVARVSQGHARKLRGQLEAAADA